VPEETIEPATELRIVCDVGACIVFSAGHLHMTAPNTSDRTRFSFDFRTLDLDDLHARRGTPNVDSKATGSAVAEFFHALDFAPYGTRSTT
jgi:hypothetical protein